MYLFFTAVRASPEPRRLPVIQEPAHHVEFTNDTGAMLSCTTKGEYTVNMCYLFINNVTYILLNTSKYREISMRILHVFIKIFFVSARLSTWNR